jgi:hypothetical protein
VPENREEADPTTPFPPMGISVGWYDLYGYNLKGQSFRIEDFPNGRYCLSITLDAKDRLREIDEDDNRRRLKFWLKGRELNPKPGEPCDGSRPLGRR